MSQDAIRNFTTQYFEDDQLQEAVAAAVQESDGSDVPGVVARVAQSKGFDVTAEETMGAYLIVKQKAIEAGVVQGELTDQELEAVAGGDFFGFRNFGHATNYGMKKVNNWSGWDDFGDAVVSGAKTAKAVGKWIGNDPTPRMIASSW